jgi:hypothetical protein
MLGAWQAQPNVPPTPAGKESTVPKRNPQHQANNPQQKEAEKLQETVRTPGFEKARPEPETEEDHSKKQPDDSLYRAYLWANILGVSGGLFALWLIWKQVKATEISAKASSKNALALMNSERAWVTVSVVPTGGYYVRSEGAAEIVLVNLGKTPAMIKGGTAKHDIVTSIQDLKYSPREWEPIIDIVDVLLSPGEPFRIRINIPMIEAHYSLAVFGIIQYEDVNQRSWFTRFMYFCDSVRPNQPITFRRIAHKYYNSYGEGHESQKEGQSNLNSNPM